VFEIGGGIEWVPPGVPVGLPKKTNTFTLANH
jgi:hypothetical protein